MFVSFLCQGLQIWMQHSWQGLRREEEGPCWPCCFWSSPGYCWCSGLGVHMAGSYPWDACARTSSSFCTYGYVYTHLCHFLKKHYGVGRLIQSDHASAVKEVTVKRCTPESGTALPAFCLSPSTTEVSLVQKLMLKLIYCIMFLRNLKFASGKDVCFVSCLKRQDLLETFALSAQLKGIACSVFQLCKWENTYLQKVAVDMDKEDKI